MKNFNILFLFLILFCFKIKSTIQATTTSYTFCGNTFFNSQANTLFDKQCGNFRKMAASCCNDKTKCNEYQCNANFCNALLNTFMNNNVLKNPCCQTIMNFFNCGIQV
ncbi:hypothetical protein Mgra_00004159 [Meloidogyne graminicola]|uniref:Transmembrane protein n=1 Tax=Meloidogyne graminicola TaxID=189291 RepID=A0A8S9ZT62_9BILA|nr:hypothetical protein Mgra_00004159 [Meloidogyne graminicola]